MADAMNRPVDPASRTRPAASLRAVGSGGRLSARRLASGLLLGLVGLPLLTVALTGLRSQVDLSSVLLLYLLLVVVVAVLGGFVPAAAAAVEAFLLANWYFTPPFHRFQIAKQADVLALIVFIAVAGVVSALVDLAARRRWKRRGPAPKLRRWPAWAARCCTATTPCPSSWSSSG